MTEPLPGITHNTPDTPTDIGRRFEQLMLRVFETHPHEYGPDRFERVWLWMDWPDRTHHDYGADIGIDLVAEQTPAYGGGLCAIQCKHYAPGNNVPTKDVNSFLAASGTDVFASRILVLTSDLERAGWTKVHKASPRCEVLGPDQLNALGVDWRSHLDDPDTLTFEPPQRHKPRPDQRDALDAVAKGYQSHSRGRLVMPCGTGKSLVAMWAAEENVGDGGQVLYLVPSIALMGQTMREWARHRTRNHSYIGVCSDRTTGRQDRDTARDLAELAMPVTTDPASITETLTQRTAKGLRVVFCTYQSLPTLTAALPDDAIFDLVICDEAHRTTGVDKPSDDEVSAFRLVHDNEALPAGFRLFMTATQRIYTAAAKQKAAMSDSDVYSMDDEGVYGPLLYEMTFRDAVDAGLLSDYEVLIVATSQSRLTAAMGDLVAQVNKGATRQAVTKADAVKLLGCWDALADPNTTGVQAGRATGTIAPTPDDTDVDVRLGHLQTAIAFTNTVRLSQAIAGITSEAPGLWQGVIAEAANGHSDELLELAVAHVDGSTPAVRRTASLDTLRGTPKPGACRVISNARVLTEGVDVPALDAVVFLQPRKSKIDIVQAVGRVMRTYPGKRKGYVVIPVVVPDGSSVNDAKVLAGSDFATVWDVVRALRSHDERMDMWVNHTDAAQHMPVTVLDRETDAPLEDATQQLEQLRLLLDEQVASKLVDMCGDRKMWPSWGAKAADVCSEVRRKVDAQLTKPAAAEAFEQFCAALRATVGDHLTDNQAAEMLAQHVVTIPIFNCLFADSTFADKNPISQAMAAMLNHLDPTTEPGELFAEELRPLTRAYTTMRTVFAGALTPAAKVDVLREIYDGFFHAAMKDAVTRLGIVYTPVEIVDFIIRSADVVCRAEFGVGLTSENVNILDPFCGTGTFIYRLLTATDANGDHIIRSEDLRRKYYSELFANELVLLAYYIAAIKIEAGMAERGGFSDGAAFDPFPGVTFGDTLHTPPGAAAGGGASLALPGMARNQQRSSRQGTVPITVILANPPWSAGQKSTGDDNPNIDYPHIEQRVRDTYGARHRQVTGLGAGKSSGNLYVQAIRWASDRLGAPDTLAGRGVIAMVHPNSLAAGTTLAGMRAALRDEFTDIFVVNLRGDAMTAGDDRQREGNNVFGQGSRNGVQITVLVRNPGKHRPDGAEVHYTAVPEYADLKTKHKWLADLDCVHRDQLRLIERNKAHDWINLTDDSYQKLIRVCATSRESQYELLTHTSAGGVMTACDPYVYAFDYNDLVNKVSAFIDIYDSTLSRVQTAESRQAREAVIAAATKNTAHSLPVIKWTSKLKQALRRGDVIEFDESRIREVMYRPFTKVWMYEDARILDKVEAVSSLFSKAPPPERLSAWQPRTTEPSSARSRRDASWTCAQQEPTNRPEPSPDGEHLAEQPVEHGHLRRSSNVNGAGSSPSGTRAKHQSGAALEAIAVKHASNAGTPDAILAASTMLDVNGLSPGIGGCRQIIRRRKPGHQR